MLQASASDHVRGRLQGIFIVVVAGGPRVADTAHGAAAALVGTAAAAAGGGVLVVVLVVAVASRCRRSSGTGSRPEVGHLFGGMVLHEPERRDGDRQHDQEQTAADDGESQHA